MSRFKRVFSSTGLALAAIFFTGCGSDASIGTFGTVYRAEYNLDTEDYREARQLAQAVLARHPRNKRALMVAGWSEFKLGNYRSALTVFQRAETIDRDDRAYGPQAGIAWSHFKLGDLDEAKAWFLKAKSKPRHFYETWDINDGLAWIAFTNNNFDRAEALFRFEEHPLQDGPHDMTGFWDFGAQKDTWVGRGLIALNRNQFAKAGKIFSEGVDRDPDYFRHYDGLARTALIEGRFEEALDYALEGADKVAFDEGLAFLIDAILQRINARQRSVEIFAGLIDGTPETAGYHAFLGRAQLKMERLKKAEASFLKAVEFDPDDDWAKSDLAKARLKMNEVVSEGWKRYFDGDYERALTIFVSKQRQGRKSGNPSAEAGRGWALLALGRFAEVKKAFEAALRIDPNFATAADGLKAAAKPHETLYDQAWTLAEAGKFKRAKRQFLRAAGQAPGPFQWKIEDGLAWLLLYQKKPGKADAAFRRVLKKYPGAYLSVKGLGFLALERGDYATAERHLFQSLSQEPGQVLTSYTLPSVGFLKAGKYKTARKLLELGDKAHADSPDIQFLLAKAYKGLNDPPKAAAKALLAATLAPVYIDPAFDDLALDPRMVRDAYMALAKGLYRAHDNAAAIKRINDFVRAGGTDPESIRLRGFALFRQGRYQEANKDLAYAIAQNPDGLPPVNEVLAVSTDDTPWKIVYDARSTLGWSNLRLGNARRATDWFRAVVKTHPMWIDALSGLGYSLLALGDRKAAVEYFQKALIQSPGYPDAWRGLGLARAAR